MTVDDPRIGMRLGGYIVEAVLGRGGMGVVYLAQQPRLARRVALKVIAPQLAADRQFRERFERESQLAASIDHPNVVTVYEAGETDDGTLFLAMGYVDGADLGVLIAREGRLEASRTVRLLGQVCAALDEAHAIGLVHRDIKPANVLVTRRRGVENAYLSDFGLTKRATSGGSVTGSGQWVGTADYVSPEQIRGQSLDARADVYSLGCVLHHVVTGAPPYDRDSDVAKIWAHVNDPPPAPSTLVADLPGDLDRVVERAMAKSPDDRFPSAGDLARAATSAVESRPVTMPERSVASGAAAPRGGATTVEAARAAAPATRPAATEAAATAAMRDASSRRPRGRRLAVGVLMLAVLIGVGAVAIGSLTGGEPDRTVVESDRSQSGPTDEDPPARRVSVDTGAFQVDAPAGWETLSTEEPAGQPAGAFMRTELVSADGGETLIVDRTPGDVRPAGERAAEVEDAVRGSPGYVRLAFEPATVGDKEAYAWEFEHDDPTEGRVRKVDYFFAADGDGYAVLAVARLERGGRAAAARRVARGAVRSLRTP